MNVNTPNQTNRANENIGASIETNARQKKNGNHGLNGNLIDANSGNGLANIGV